MEDFHLTSHNRSKRWHNFRYIPRYFCKECQLAKVTRVGSKYINVGLSSRQLRPDSLSGQTSLPLLFRLAYYLSKPQKFRPFHLIYIATSKCIAFGTKVPGDEKDYLCTSPAPPFAKPKRTVREN